VLDKSQTGELTRIDVDETYGPMFESSMPGSCPIVSMEALNRDSTSLTSNFVSFVNMNDGSNYFLEISRATSRKKRV